MTAVAAAVAAVNAAAAAAAASVTCSFRLHRLNGGKVRKLKQLLRSESMELLLLMLHEKMLLLVMMLLQFLSIAVAEVQGHRVFSR